MAKASPKTLENGQDYSLSSKESSISLKKNSGEASFRVLYYGGAAGSVPFLWESQPGTPKHTSDDRPPPPLTPPPSYLCSQTTNPSRKKNPLRSKICTSMFSRSHSKKSNVAPTFSPSSSHSSSSHSVFLGPGRDEFGPEPEPRSPSSILCFGPRVNGTSRACKGYYYHPIKNVKKVVLSIVGHAKVNK